MKVQTKQKLGNVVGTVYYVFQLSISIAPNKSQMNQSVTGAKSTEIMEFRMMLHEMNVKPQAIDLLKDQTTISIDSMGLFHQVCIQRIQNLKRVSEDDQTEIVMSVQITSDNVKVLPTGLQTSMAKLIGKQDDIGVNKKELTFSFARQNYDEQ